MTTTELSAQDWKANLTEIGAKEGFFEELGHEHSALFIKRGETLIVTFENLDHVYEHTSDRMPWGYDFVQSRGWSMLGLMAHDWTWYRDEAVFDFFDRLRDEGFFDQFTNVVFYGASMGAYAASVFSAAAPESTVICIAPQATLRRDIASWETRYRKAWKRDFSGRYAYGPEMVQSAKAMYLFYDPRSPLDAMHAALYSGDNIRKMRCRYFGHRMASLWLQMKILKPIILDCVDGTLTDAKFYSYLRARRDNNRYCKEMVTRLENAGKPKRIVQYCEAVLSRRRGPAFRQALKRAQAEIAKRSKKK